jgi:hypothetical protein
MSEQALLNEIFIAPSNILQADRFVADNAVASVCMTGCSGQCKTQSEASGA